MPITSTPSLPSSSSLNRRLVPSVRWGMLLVLPMLLLTPPLQRTIDAATGRSEPYAQGNLFVTFEAKVGRQYANNPLTANLTDLWCQATRPPGDGERLRVKQAQFSHVIPPPNRIYEADVDANRAHLRFGHVSTERVGKYRCEIITLESQRVQGNLFVYMRPVFHSNGSFRLDPSKDEPFHIIGSSMRVVRGATAQLTCPAIGYPIPNITWFRDGQPISTADSERVILAGSQLHIRDTDYADEGLYRCVARNAFPAVAEGPEHVDEATLDRHLRVASSLAWVAPLVVIVLILLALIIIIYACAIWKRRQHNQYNVAEREKRLRKPEEQRLQDHEQDEDE